MFLDEPTAHLDEPNRIRVFEVLDQFLEKAASVVLVSHLHEDHEMLAALGLRKAMRSRSLRVLGGRLVEEER